MKYTVNDIETFAENIPGAEGLAVANDGHVFVGAEDGWLYAISPELVAPANPAFGGLNLDELYITNLIGHSVSRLKDVPRGQPLVHQL